jgi:MFS family permease
MVATIEVTPEVRKGRNKLAATVVVGHAVKHVFNSALQATLLPELKLEYDLSASAFGALSTAGRVTSGMTTMVAGYLGDRFVNRAGLMLAISLGLMGASYFLLGIVVEYWMLFGVMLLIGIGPSLYHPPAIASLSRKFPDRRGFAISLHGTGGSVGEVVGPVLTGALITGTYLVAFTWHEVLRISVIPALIFAALIWLSMRNIPAADSGTKSFADYYSGLFRLLRERAMLMLVGVTALRSMGQSSIMAFLPVYLREDLGHEAIEVGAFMASAQVAGIIAQPIMGYLSDRVGRKIVLVPAMIVLGGLFITLRFAAPGIPLTVVILAMGSFLYSLHTIFIAAAMDVSKGEAQSTVVSLIYGASFFGTFSPFLAGVIVDSTAKTGNAFIYAGVVVLISTVLLAVVKLPKTANQMAVRH